MMDRFALLVFTCAAVGCRGSAPTFDPFAAYGQTRVPPPPTGAAGKPDPYYPGAAPYQGVSPYPYPGVVPPATQGGSNQLAPPSVVPRSDLGSTPTPARLTTASAQALTTAEDIGSQRNEPAPPTSSLVRAGNELTWIDPRLRSSVATVSGTVPPDRASHVALPETVEQTLGPYGEARDDSLLETGAGLAPAPLAAPEPAALLRQPVHTSGIVPNSAYTSRPGPPRVRGFLTSGIQPVQIPPELTATTASEAAAEGVEVSAARWEPRPVETN